MRKIFISYRRTEAEYAAGALGRDLRRRFGDEQIFRDKEDIGGGVAWKQKLLHEIDRDCALLVLIGRDWANVKDSEGRRRLDNPDDGLRLEILDGIKDGAAILPVLLENAQMPAESELPAELRRLSEFNALQLRDGDWQYDVDKICRTLERVGFKAVGSSPEAPLPAQPAQVAAPKNRISVKGIIGAVLVVLAFAALGSQDADSATHVGVAVLSAAGLVLGILAWRESPTDRYAGRILSGVVSSFAVLGFLGALGGMASAPGERPQGSQAAPQAAPESATQQPDSARRAAPDGAVAPELRASDAGGLTSVNLLRGHAVLRYDPGLWKATKTTPPEPGNFQYAHTNGEVFFKVITERIPIGLEKLADFGFANAQNVDPNARITRRGSRRVNGLQMLTRDIDVTTDDIAWTFYVHYYSDASSAVQLVGWTGRALIQEHRSTIEQFVSGFEVGDRTR